MKVHILHIPKTGGISLFRALQTAGVDVTRSHDPMAVPDDALIVSLLRNPIDRAWSVYHHQVRQGFLGPLSVWLQQELDPWWWGVHSVQSRYMRPGVMIGITTQIYGFVQHICVLAEVDAPPMVEWHGKDEDRSYTPQEYAQLAAAVGTEDRALYGIVERGW